MDQAKNAASFGKLTVQTTAASGAIPIMDATVVIRVPREEGGMRILNILHTDIDGKTRPIEIETPSPTESLSPGGGIPYSEVSIEVSAPGYYSVVDMQIPIYPGITSIQPIWMLPLPESSGSSFYPSGDLIVNESSSSPNL